MYTPHVGRWLSRDDAGFIDGPNRYLYVKNGPVNAVDPSGLQAAPSDPTCTVVLKCVHLGLPLIGPRHCGVEITDSQGHTRYHVRGSIGEDALCKFVEHRVGFGLSGNYWSEKTWTVNERVCECIRDTVELINSKKLPYTPEPRRSCAGESTCNSNYAAHCVLLKCGLDYQGWGWFGGAPQGWDHRMKKCTKWHYVTAPPGVAGPSPPSCHCICDEEESIDDEWCEP